MNRLTRIVLIAAVAFTLGPAAFAAGGTEGSWLGVPRVVWAWANLFVFWGLLWRFAGPALQEFLKNRREAIAEGIDRAKNQAAEAEKMRAELTAQLAELKADLAEQRERARVEAQRERERILEQAQADREKLLAQTEQEIGNRVHQAEARLRKVAAGLAADLAEKQVRENVGSDERARLFNDSLQSLREVSQEDSVQ